MSSRLPILLLVVLMGLALWPLPQILFTHEALGHPTSDLADHIHGAWWFGGELLDGRWPRFSTATHYPEAPALWYIDPIGGLLAGVLFRPLGAAAAWNLSVLTQLTVAALVAWKMGTDLLESTTASVVLALTVTCSAPVLGFVHSGLGEFLGLAPATGLIWASIRAMGRDPRGRPPSRASALWMGSCLALCALQTPYYGVFGGLWILCMLPGSGWKNRLPPLGLASGVAAVPVALIGWGIHSSLSHPDAAIRAETAPGWSPVSLPATDLMSFIHPGRWYHPDTPALGNPGILHISYLGIGALVFLIVHRMRSPERRLGLGLATLLFAILCLGPALSLLRWSPGVPLPMALLFVAESPLRALHHPYRIIGFAMPLLGLWLAWASVSIPRRIQLGLPVLLIAETLYLSPAPWPLQTLDTQAPPVYASLPSGPVLDWPADATVWNRRYLVWQTEHERPVAVGVNVFVTPTLRRDPLVGELMGDLDDINRRAKNRDVPFPGAIEPGGSRDASGLRRLGYRSLVLHIEALSSEEEAQTRRTLEATLGAPDYQSETALAWDL